MMMMDDEEEPPEDYDSEDYGPEDEVPDSENEAAENDFAMMMDDEEEPPEDYDSEDYGPEEEVPVDYDSENEAAENDSAGKDDPKKFSAENIVDDSGIPGWRAQFSKIKKKGGKKAAGLKQDICGYNGCPDGFNFSTPAGRSSFVSHVKGAHGKNKIICGTTSCPVVSDDGVQAEAHRSLTGHKKGGTPKFLLDRRGKTPKKGKK